MAGLSEELKESEKQKGRKGEEKANKGVRDDIEVEDDEVRLLV